RPSVLWCAHLFVLLGQVRHDMHPSWIEPEEKWLAILSCLVKKLQRVCQYLVVNCLHAFWAQFARIFDFLFSDFAPARLNCRTVDIRCPAVDHVARTNRCLECRWVVGMARVLHGVQVVQIPVELIETMHRRQELVSITEMVLAELPCCVAHRFKRGGDGR